MKRRSFLLLYLAVIINCGSSEKEIKTFLMAIKNKDTSIIKSLLNAGLNPNLKIKNKKGIEKSSFLQEAITSDSLEVVKILLISGANLNYKPTDSRAPLTHAISLAIIDSNSLKIPIIQELLKKGANPDLNEKDQGGSSLLYEINHSLGMVCEHCYGAGYENEIECAKTCKQSIALSSEIFELLLKAGANPNARDTSGTTMLRDVAFLWSPLKGRFFNKKTYELLLRYKADPNIQDNDNGQTELMIATSNNNTERITLLLKYGAKKDIKDKKGKTALDYAIEKGNSEAIKLLK